MKLDTHVHTVHSGRSTIRPLDRFLRESYNTPEGVYRRAEARGMDLVAITDHDRSDGALTIADRPDVIVGSEVTGVFPNDAVPLTVALAHFVLEIRFNRSLLFDLVARPGHRDLVDRRLQEVA